MTAEKTTAHLSVNLVKPGITAPRDIIRTGDCNAPIAVPISGHAPGALFIRKSDELPPAWARMFESVLDTNLLAVPHVSAAFLLEVGGRHFVLAFGQGGRFLINEDVTEERFGLVCALNTVDPKTFRSVDVQSLDAIQSHTRIQSGEATTPDQFGLNVEQDMLKAIVGAPRDARLGMRMTGHDSLSISVKGDLADLPFLLNEYRKAYEAELSAEDYEWVNNIALVDDPTQITDLEAQLTAKFSACDFSDMWLAIPEIIDWTVVVGFVFTAGKREAQPDININGFLKTIKQGQVISVELLRQRRVYCVDANHKKVFANWSVYRCLYAELESKGEKYVLNDAKWFKVDGDFVDRTNKAFAATPMSSISLPAYKGGGETAYNLAIATTQSTLYALLDDKKKIMHGGGHGQVEVCDLLSMKKELIHIKIYGKSSVFSHLFAQGFVSGQLIQTDSDFRQKVRKQVPPSFRKLIQVKTKPEPEEFTIVYGVISEDTSPSLHLPFFSRVNLNNTRKVLLGFGYKVELMKIDVDPAHAKLVRLPPSKKTSS